jgi:hypothetical protein
MAKIVVSSPNLTQPLLLYPGLGPAMLDNISGVDIKQFKTTQIKSSTGRFHVSAHSTTALSTASQQRIWLNKVMKWKLIPKKVKSS